MAVTSDGILLSSFGKVICCHYRGCGNPATGVAMLQRITFLCDEHSHLTNGQFRRFAKGQSFAELIGCTEIEIDCSAAAGEESPHGESRTSP